MTIIEKIKDRIIKFLGVQKLNDNPNSERYNFISSEDVVIKQHLNEYKIWYIGDSDELLNFYTNREITGNAENPIYNRNKTEYFWGINPEEFHVKRVHSGVPNAIVSTLSNAIGDPIITAKDEYQKTIDDILEDNTFKVMLNQQQRPLTLVEGWGAYKVSFDKSISKFPIIEYYEADDVDFVIKKGVCVGIIYKDYYKYQSKDYLLLETRSINNGDSKIEYELFRLDKSNSLEKVPLNTIPELSGLDENGKILEGYKKILGVPSKYFFDPLNKKYGRSIFAGKIDLFDDLDQSLSQRSKTCKVSTPREYFPVDAMERDSNGNPIFPKVYDRQFIKSVSYPNGDGETNGTIQTTQPQLNFDQYSNEQRAILDMILTGVLSPASLGIDIAKKDNADAQREKEKVTIQTRNNVIAMENKIIKELITICLDIKEYIDTGKITIGTDYGISVKYNEFANPSFESLSQVLTPMFTQGAISTEMYVDKLYGDSLSAEEKQKEIEWLNKKQSEDNLQESDFELGGEEDEANARKDLRGKAKDNTKFDKSKI